MANWLGQFSFDALACGPSLHHRETLSPLAEATGKNLLVDDRFDPEAPRSELVKRVLELGEAGAIVCLSRPILQEVLSALVGPASFDLDSPNERGAAWFIEGEPRRATYFAPRGAARDLGEPIAPLEALTLLKAGSSGAKKAGKRAARTARSRVAVLDMGSTSFHLLVAEWTPDGELRRIARDRVMLRMGSELARSSRIAPDLLDRSIDAVQSLCAFAKEHKAEKLVAVGTAALRDASNSPKVVRALESAIGGPVHLLSGEDEARIVHRAIRARIDLGRDVHLGLDLGGGSLEIIVGRGNDVLLAKSLPLGVTRLHGTIAPAEPHTKDDLRALRHAVREELAPVLDEIKALAPVDCIAVGGTARALCRVILRERQGALGAAGALRERQGARGAAGALREERDVEAPKKGSAELEVRGRRLERTDLAALGRELAAQTLEERLERPGVSSRRADLLPFGAEILTSVLSLLEMRTLTICDWGLREGVLLNLLDSEQ